MSTHAERRRLRGLAEAALRREVGATAVGRLCPRCGGSDHGRPWVRVADGPAPWVSLAYADGLAALAWSVVGPVGVDVEVDGPPVEGVGDRTAWTRTEALLKATGEGLGRDPLDLPDLPVAPLDLPEGYVGHVAGRGVSWRLLGPAAPARPAPPAGPAARAGRATH